VSIAIGARSKSPGEYMAGEEKELFMCDTTPEAREAYERLIGDALRGDPTLFSRQDGVEAAWAIVDPVLHTEGPVYRYERGSWGPREADRLVGSIGGWRNPA
jgi:glucose-6-phosphate 1-dehydrogenase